MVLFLVGVNKRGRREELTIHSRAAEIPCGRREAHFRLVETVQQWAPPQRPREQASRRISTQLLR